MSQELKIPELGEGVENGQVVAVKVSPGDTVAVESAVLELETGKAVVEVPAEKAGVVEQVLVSPGDEVKVGQAFLLLADDEASEAEVEKADDEKAATASDEASDKDSGEASDEKSDEGKKQGGDAGKKGADDAAAPTESEARKATSSSSPSRPSLPELEKPPATARHGDGHVPAAPSVRRFAREVGVDVDTVRGGGPHGRVSIEDVKRHLRRRYADATPGVPGLPLPELPDFSRSGAVRREKMSGIRLATAKQVARCWTTIPQVTHFDHADITSLEALRQKYKERAAREGGHLTMAVMVVKVVALALKKFPEFNASVDMARREVVYKDYVNVGIAVATERGLLVPVLRDAERKNMLVLAREIEDVAGKCRQGKIKPDELQGGSFTVTNLGSIGGSHFTPIVNFPEVAILGMGRAAEHLALVDGKVVARTLLPLSLSYDHRLIDGAAAARFTRWVAEAIEEPLLLSLEG